ncbi:MAG: hypothetical protein HXX11_09590 [Desulfuromonadales bacterium]|nr:hypothetical protein [Desulfuromonadales bacterium]
MNKQLQQPPDSRDSGSLPPQPDRSQANTLTVTYNGFMKAVLAIGGMIALTVLSFFVTGEEFVLHVTAVGGVVALLLYLVECLTTVNISLEPDRIVKRRLFFGETVIPAQRAILVADQYGIRFYHGCTTNRRERVTILLQMISRDEAEEALEYARKRYRFQLREERTGEDETVTLEGGGAGKERKVNVLTLEQFGKAHDTYRSAAACMAANAVIVALTVGLADSFDGFGQTLPVAWIRGAAIVLAVLAYLPLSRLNQADTAAATSAAKTGRRTWSERAKVLENRTLATMLLIGGVELIGFILFLLFGNLLDFYLFLAVGACYYVDFYPRLSAWERLSEAKPERSVEAPAKTPLAPLPSKRRSLQVSLVLMGALAASSYGESRQYLYKSKKDCLDDWGSDQDCREPSQGSVHYRSGYYYGPRYGGSGRGGMRSVGTVSVSRGGFGSLGGFHASFGG